MIIRYDRKFLTFKEASENLWKISFIFFISFLYKNWKSRSDLNQILIIWNVKSSGILKNKVSRHLAICWHNFLLIGKEWCLLHTLSYFECISYKFIVYFVSCNNQINASQIIMSEAFHSNMSELFNVSRCLFISYTMLLIAMFDYYLL